MSIDIKEYLTEQYIKTAAKDKATGSVITISRQFGCSAKEYAGLLGQKLNELERDRDDKSDWTWISKRIFVEKAQEHHLKASRIIRILEGQKTGLIDSILMSASEKYYSSDNAILKKIVSVIHSIAEVGHIIIIGLGAEVITQDIKKSLHIRLEAPFKWRVEQISKKYGKSIAEAEILTKETDAKREAFRKMYTPKSNPNELFDITFNIAMLSKEEIIDSIISLMKKRKII